MSNTVESESLMILDGLYGVISEIIGQIPNKMMQSLLASRILRELRIIINIYKENEDNEEYLRYYNGNIINNARAKQNE